MKKYNLKTFEKKILADTLTPVSVYLKLRDHFPNTLLLESSDYHANDNSFSYICFNPISYIKIQGNVLKETFPDGTEQLTPIDKSVSIPARIEKYIKSFKTTKNSHKFINNGLFGYLSYDSVKFFESINLEKKSNSLEIPELYYAVYQNIVAINHFNNEAFLFCHCFNNKSNLEEIEQLLTVKNFTNYPFTKMGNSKSAISDKEYKDLVSKAKKHCQRGDVFQLVLSRRFSQEFKGDDFNLYRALRTVNPSPYLFYFDYGDFKIFGSSPEAQLIVKDNQAEIHPIAGTFKRTGNDEKDAKLAIELSQDPKENAEHVMLVDLARNDLSRNGSLVKVKTNREVQFFSHVIHLVSKVTGIKKAETPTFQLVADTFPAGTLSGAPKYKALELIEKYEKINRGFYGGAIGFMDFEGNFNHAIIIRSFLSKNHTLFYQAGAGIVAASDEENELQEVYNKLGALIRALEIAENI
ncbi:MAG: anthranilate synthase component 1 [Candidatus Marivariicella framensis]|jgi:anthranilate synthase component 1|tara:strand:+ start:4709 stop:6109 length:1401 start_codon:yes stop_codon:yes gene_type:complete